MQNRSRTHIPHRPMTRPRAPDLEQRRLLLGELVRGCVFLGAAFLLGSCPLLAGAAPLGLGLLAASSAYTWYILGGLLLSAALRPVMLAGWAWVGVYLLCIILRLMIRFFVDPPALPDGRPCNGRTYLLLCWESFKTNLGLNDRTSRTGDTESDYYEGRDFSGRYGDGAEGDKPPRRRPVGPPVPLFAEHPFLRMLTAGEIGRAHV